jgi:D-sedoheptulose 7-phosphate isomerase
MENVQKNMEESSDALREFAKTESGALAGCAKAIVQCLRAGGKVLACGNGGSASQAQHFAAELVGRFEKERAAWSAVALTTDTSILTSLGNDYGFDEIFARQVRALGKKGDALLGISTSGRSPNVVKALEAARDIGMITIGLTGRGGADMKPLLDHRMDVPAGKTYRIQEVHLAALHQICRIVEESLTGGGAA